MSIETRVETIKCNKSKCDCYGFFWSYVKGDNYYEL